jgi:hypothetical protein
MKNAMTPMTATPPATDSPIIEPVPNPELVVDVLVLEAAAPEELAVSDKVCVKVWVPALVGEEVKLVGVVTDEMEDDADVVGVVADVGVVVGVVVVGGVLLVACWVVDGGVEVVPGVEVDVGVLDELVGIG